MPLPPDYFRGKLQEYLRWAKLHNEFNPYLCAKHWAPCPVEGKPGILVSIVLMQESFAFFPPDVTTPEQMNSWMMNQTKSICCRLGDKKMDFLWDIIDMGPGVLCYAQPPTERTGSRVCWRQRGHLDEHEWERPYPRSVFDLMAELEPLRRRA